jgi:hypothetical protein
MGQGAQSGAGSRPGLAAPATLAGHHDEDAYDASDNLDDQDDW